MLSFESLLSIGGSIISISVIVVSTISRWEIYFWALLWLSFILFQIQILYRKKIIGVLDNRIHETDDGVTKLSVLREKEIQDADRMDVLISDVNNDAVCCVLVVCCGVVVD